MKESVQKLNLEQEYYTEENCHITEVSNGSADPELSIARARVEPGVTTRWHRLRDTTERYVIVSGTGRVEVGDLTPQEVSPGDVVIIPALRPQRISNTGADDLIFLAICSPRFKAECYEDIGAGLE
jgi:mannose-6-phosphate isomerase-like protein (cupin superfamily)